MCKNGGRTLQSCLGLKTEADHVITVKGGHSKHLSVHPQYNACNAMATVMMYSGQAGLLGPPCSAGDQAAGH